MTTEHKILALVDRGVINIDDIGEVVGRTVGGAMEVWAVIHEGMADRDRDCLTLTPKGLDRLNELDEIRRIRVIA